MANFADELREAPKKSEQQRKLEEKRKMEEWGRKCEEEHARIIDTLMQCFELDCRKVAATGKRSIDYRPNASRPYSDRPCGLSDSNGAVCYGNTLTSALVGKLDGKREAESLIPQINQRLSSMGFHSYTVSTISFTTSGLWGPRYHVGFRIQASW